MENELKHYGVKGMHWGIRRFQPYPDGKNGQFIGRHAANKAKRAMNFNSYRISQAEHYKNKSQKRKNKFLNKAKIAKTKGNLDKMNRMQRKANKEQEDINFHKNTINEAKKAINDSIKKLSAGGYDVSSITKKGKIFADRKISDALFRPRLDMASNGGLIGLIGAPTGDVTRYKVKAKNHDSYKVNKGRSSNKISEHVNDYLDSRNIPDNAKDEIRRAGVRYLDAYNKAQDHATKADFAPANKVKTHYANYHVAMKKADDYYRDYKKVQDKWDFDVDNDDDLDVLESFRDKIKKK